MTERERSWGLLAGFGSVAELHAAIVALRAAGYRHMDAYTPLPVEGLAEALGQKRSWVPLITLCGALAGGIFGFWIQWWTAVVDFPINVGGRPFNSWPAFLLVTFEMAVLVGACTAFAAMLALNRLPRLHHPLFGVGEFDLASRNRFYLAIEASDPLFDPVRTRQLLQQQAPLSLREVPP
ncbi:MAG TPA: DUF3341 domain-containing protein [Gammaproteobacteria bacterium]|nr:DUF3341 domain-containing protein [Gammaproteobacteria bacterium]